MPFFIISYRIIFVKYFFVSLILLMFKRFRALFDNNIMFIIMSKQIPTVHKFYIEYTGMFARLLSIKQTLRQTQL